MVGTSATNSATLQKARRVDIGRQAHNAINHAGLIDDVRIYDRVITQPEITDLANGN